VARIWENALPGGSGREVLTDAGEVTTEVVGGAVAGVVGTVEAATGMATGDTALTGATRGRVDDGAGCRVAPSAPPAIAPMASNPIKT
jgi:hypothetical protein